MFSIGMGALLLLLVELASGGRLITVLHEMISPTFIEHESGNKTKNEFIKAFNNAKNIDYMSLTFSLPRTTFTSDDFEKKIKEGGCFRILVSDKNSRFLEDRAKHNNIDVDIIKKDIEDTIIFFDKLYKQLKGNKDIKGRLYLRIHNELPYRGYSRFDNRTFVTPYLTDNSAATGPVLEITRATSFLCNGYKTQFEAFWNNAESVINIHQFQHRDDS